jgi:hypothetical protein
MEEPMKKQISICMSLVAVLILSGQAIEAREIKQAVPFSQYSAASGTAVYSPAVNVSKFRTKTIQVNGYNMSTKAEASLSGTLLVQCGPTSSGPWVTCVQEDSTAISTTANGILQWSDVASFVRVSWAKTAGRVSAWLNLSD